MHVHERNAEKKRLNGLMLKSPMRVYRAFGELGAQVFADGALAKKAFAHLATVGPDGRPQVTPVWADFDGTYIRINTARGRVKDRNLKANPNVALSLQDPDNPYRYVQVRGRVAEMTEQGAD